MKYKLNDIVYNSIYKQYGWIWSIEDGHYIIKWFGRSIIDGKMWGQWNEIEKTDNSLDIRPVNDEERILFGPKTDF